MRKCEFVIDIAYSCLPANSAVLCYAEHDTEYRKTLRNWPLHLENAEPLTYSLI